jgi:hypothetical protein
MDHGDDLHRVLEHAVDHQVPLDRKAWQARTQVVPRPPHPWMPAQRAASLVEKCHEPLGPRRAVVGDVIVDARQIGSASGRKVSLRLQRFAGAAAVASGLSLTESLRALLRARWRRSG